MPGKDNITVSVNQPKAKEKKESKLRSFFKFGKGKASDGKGLTDKHSSDPDQKGKPATITPQSNASTTKVDPLSSSTVPPSSSKPNFSNPPKVPPGKTQMEQTSSDTITASTIGIENVPTAPIGASSVIQNPPDTTKSPPSSDETQPTIAHDLETETQSPSQGKTRQRRAAEEAFKIAVENLQKLMLEIAGKGNPQFITTVVRIDDFDDFDKNVKEIGSAIDNFMDKRTELRAQKGQIKEIAEKWYKACFPFVKGGLGIASNFVPSPYAVVVNAFSFIMQVAYNASRYKEQVDETIAFLSETILHFELLTSRDLKGVVDEERLEGFYFTGIKLSAAIVECLTVAIKLITSMFEALTSAITTAATSVDKDQKLVDAQAKVDTATKVYNTFIGDLNVILLSQFLAKEKKKEIINWLEAKQSSSRHKEFSQKRVSGSGMWFVESNEFKDWVSGSSKMLIGYGNEGAGKSFIASCVIDQLKTDPDSGLAFIYFDYNEKLSAGEMIVSLLAQLLGQCQNLPASIQSEYNPKRKDKPTNIRFIELLLDCISEFPKVFVVLDAFDETQKEERGKLIEYLKQISNSRLNLFITTRSPLLDLLQKDFQESTDMEIAARDDDIQTYLIEKLNAESLHVKIKENISTKLSAGAHGKFRLVEFQLKYVLNEGSPGRINAALGSLPKSLPDAYHKVVDQMEEGQKIFAFQIMSWILRAGRLLTIDELCEALSIQEDCDDLQEELIPEPDFVVKTCESLVEVDKESREVRFTHQTVKDFLQGHDTSLMLSNIDLAKVCLVYLGFSEFEKRCDALDLATWDARMRKYKFSQYAILFWGLHTKGAGEGCVEVRKRLYIAFKSAEKFDSFIQLLGGELSRGFDMPFLHIMVRTGLATICRMLLDEHSEEIRKLPLYIQKCDLLAVTVSGETPLHLAANEAHTEVARVLIDKNPSLVAAQDENGHTALHTMILGSEGNTEFARLLLDNDADVVSVQSIGGETALHFATLRNQENIVELLIEKNADAILIQDEEGQTALHWAIGTNQDDMLELLIEKKADAILIQDNEGETVLHWAIQRRMEWAVKLFVEKCPDVVSIRNLRNETALDLALREQDWMSESTLRLLSTSPDEMETE